MADGAPRAEWERGLIRERVHEGGRARDEGKPTGMPGPYEKPRKKGG